MLDRRTFLRLLATSAAICPAVSFAQQSGQYSEPLHLLLNESAPIDYLQAKLALDRIIDPRQDSLAIHQTVEHLAARAREMAGESADEVHKLAAVRTLIYQPGVWNENRPFAYDHADPFGHDIRNKLLGTYLRTRLGNCVSMPILFLILADQVGVNVSLARAPHHLLIRWREPSGREVNLECTSGGLPARDIYYRENLPPITDEAIAHGVYLRALSRRENAAELATTVAEYFYAQRRFQEAIDVCAAIVEASPNDAATMVLEASCYAGLIHDEFEQPFPTPDLIPPGMRPRFEMLSRMNEGLFTQAEALGWREAQ